MIKNNYHTHVAYCNHAVGNVEDYVRKAIELGFQEIGITDHAPILEEFMSSEEYKVNWCEQNMKIDTVPIYLKDIEEARRRYGRHIRILSGFESEFLPSELSFYASLRKKVDYLNLGVHYYRLNNRIYNSYSEVDYRSLEGYVQTAISGMESGLFNTLVHPDLFMFAYRDKHGNRCFDEYCADAARRICEAAVLNRVYVEVNANGLKNSVLFGNSKDWLYPVKAFWEIAREYSDLRIIIGADAHDPNHLANENVEAVCRFCEDLNLHIQERMEILH